MCILIAAKNGSQTFVILICLFNALLEEKHLREVDPPEIQPSERETQQDDDVKRSPLLPSPHSGYS